MDSINQNQPEENRRDLRGAGAIEKLKELVGKAETCFFCTAFVTTGSSGARPMSVQQVDEEGNLWFLSAADRSCARGDSERSRSPKTSRCSVPP